MSPDPEAPEDVAGAIADAELFATLVQRHAAWVAAVGSVGIASAGGRDRLITAEIALAELEALAPRAGLLLADALAGHAPDVRARLLLLLAPPDIAPDPIIVAVPESVPLPVLGPDAIPLQLGEPVPAPVLEPAAVAEPVSVLKPIPPPVPPPPPVPVTGATMALLKASLSGELKSVPLVGTAKLEHKALEALRKILGGVPPDLKTRGQLLGLLKQVELTVTEVRTWAQLSRRGRRLLVEGIAARIRAIQEAEGGISEMQYADDVRARTAKLMRALRNETTDGKLDRAAWGLALRHDAQSSSWLQDARQVQAELEDELGIEPAAPTVAAKFNADDGFRRLREDVLALSPESLSRRIAELLANGVTETDKRFVKLLEPRLPELVQDRALVKLTRAVASALAEDDEPGDAPKPIDANWYGFAHTAGKSAVIVGGDGRSERSVVLQAAFRFAELDWPDIPKNSPGKANALVGQVRKGKYQIVICLQPFISHKLTDQLFDLDVPGTKVVLAQGYGMLQIKLALERYLPRPK